MKRLAVLAAALVASAALSGCAYDEGYYGPAGPYGAPEGYHQSVYVGPGYGDTWYDGYYGPLNGGYWDGGSFYYDDGDGYRMDRGEHFRHRWHDGFRHYRWEHDRWDRDGDWDD